MPKKGLGKGLKALIPDYDLVGDDYIDNQIPINNIIPNHNQPRIDFTSKHAIISLKELTNSIKLNGVLQPITVRKIKNNKYEIIAGERRWRASKAAGLKTIPCYIINIENDSKMLELALVENLQRENLNPIEEAESYLILKEKYNLSQDEIAKKVGKARTTISNSIRLLKLPSNIKTSLKNGLIQAGHARALLKFHRFDKKRKMENLFKRIKNENLSVRQVEEISSKMIDSKKYNQSIKKKIQKKILNTDIQTYEENLRTIFGTKVKIEQKKNGTSKIIIDIYSSEELNRILEIVSNFN